eukprot:scaffold9837_cov94-Isochrysis_galbana.AAC.4
MRLAARRRGRGGGGEGATYTQRVGYISRVHRRGVGWGGSATRARGYAGGCAPGCVDADCSPPYHPAPAQFTFAMLTTLPPSTRTIHLCDAHHPTTQHPHNSPLRSSSLGSALAPPPTATCQQSKLSDAGGGGGGEEEQGGAGGGVGEGRGGGREEEGLDDGDKGEED